MIGICTPEGMDKLERVGASFFSMVHAGQDIDVKHFRRMWEHAHSTQTGFLLAEFDGDTPKGLLGLIIREDVWTKGKVAAVLCWYSEGKEGLKLLKRAEQIARQAGAKTLTVQHMAGSETIGRYYKRKGFIENTVAYKKEL